MKNRVVGMIIVAFAIVVGVMTYLFNLALHDVVNASCSMGETCAMWTPVKFNTNINIGIVIAIFLFGLYFIFFSKDDLQGEFSSKEIKKNYSAVKKKLTEDENAVFEKILANQGTIFQSELVEQMGWSKVKVTRILDRMEGKGIIERRRRGMTNVVILKDKHE